MNFQDWLIYLTFMLLSCAFAFRAERSNYNPVWVAVTYLFIVGFWAVRYKIGFDYKGYMEIFASIKYGGYSYVEPGYYYLNKLFAFSSHGYVYVIGLTTALIYLFLFKMLLDRRILFYGIFFALSFQFQFLAANQIRQAVVIAGFLYVVRYIEQKKYWAYTIRILLLMLFHYSALFLLIAIPLSKIRLPKWCCFGALVGAFVLLRSGVLHFLGTAILQSLPFYEAYQNNLARMQAEDIGFSIVIVFYILVACYLIIYRDTIRLPALFNVYIIGFTLYILFVDFHLINRIMQYLIFLNVILASVLCKHNFRQGALLFIVTFLVFNLLAARDINQHGIHPYSTVFERQIDNI